MAHTPHSRKARRVAHKRLVFRASPARALAALAAQRDHTGRMAHSLTAPQANHSPDSLPVAHTPLEAPVDHTGHSRKARQVAHTAPWAALVPQRELVALVELALRVERALQVEQRRPLARWVAAQRQARWPMLAMMAMALPAAQRSAPQLRLAPWVVMIQAAASRNLDRSAHQLTRQDAHTSDRAWRYAFPGRRSAKEYRRYELSIRAFVASILPQDNRRAILHATRDGA